MDESTAAPTESAAPVETGGGEVAPAIETAAPEATANLLTPPVDGITPDTSGDSWLNSLDEEYRSNPNVNKYQSPNEMAKGMINMSSLIGKKGIIKPGENATPEEMGNYYNSIGRPSESNMYKYEGEGEVDPDGMAKYQEYAHNAGYTQEQFQSGIEFQQKFEQDAMERFEQEKVDEASTTQMELMDEMGEVEYKAFLGDASKAAEALGLHDVLVNNGLGGNKEVLKALANASKHLGSSNIIGDQGNSALDFDGQIEEVRSHEGFNNKLHPMHQELMNKIDKLYERRYPNK